MAHIERRGPGRWRARFRDPSGRERSKTFPRRSDAERFLTSIEHSKLVGGYIDPSAGRVTFARFSARWLESQTFDASTREAVGSRLRVHLLPAFGDLELREIRPSTTQSWQVKLLHGQPLLAPPKARKTREVPLPDIVAVALAERLRNYPAVDGLVFTSREHKLVNRTYFNPHVWKPALIAAGVPPTRNNGMHALRHFYASALLEAGTSICAVADYLGHQDPASRCAPTRA